MKKFSPHVMTAMLRMMPVPMGAYKTTDAYDKSAFGSGDLVNKAIGITSG